MFLILNSTCGFGSTRCRVMLEMNRPLPTYVWMRRLFNQDDSPKSLWEWPGWCWAEASLGRLVLGDTADALEMISVLAHQAFHDTKTFLHQAFHDTNTQACKLSSLNLQQSCCVCQIQQHSGASQVCKKIYVLTIHPLSRSGEKTSSFTEG